MKKALRGSGLGWWRKAAAVAETRREWCAAGTGLGRDGSAAHADHKNGELGSAFVASDDWQAKAAMAESRERLKRLQSRMAAKMEWSEKAA